MLLSFIMPSWNLPAYDAQLMLWEVEGLDAAFPGSFRRLTDIWLVGQKPTSEQVYKRFRNRLKMESLEFFYEAGMPIVRVKILAWIWGTKCTDCLYLPYVLTRKKCQLIHWRMKSQQWFLKSSCSFPLKNQTIPFFVWAGLETMRFIDSFPGPLSLNLVLQIRIC